MLLWILQPLGLRSTFKTNGMMIKNCTVIRLNTHLFSLSCWQFEDNTAFTQQWSFLMCWRRTNTPTSERIKREKDVKKKQRVWKKGREENKAGRKGHVFAGEVALQEQRGVVLHMRWSCGRRREEDSLERKRRGSCSPELSILYVTCVFVSSTFSGWCTWRRYTTQCFPQCLFSFLFSVVVTSQTKTFSLQ